MSDNVARVQFMRDHGIVVADWNEAGALTHCELGPEPTAAPIAQKTDEDPTKLRQAEERRQRALMLAATGGPVHRAG